MESKYYTPTIEEFHVGFEYELKFMGKQYSYTFKFNQFDSDDLVDEIVENRIRIKYLDREDIESLGWKYDKQYPGYPWVLYSKETNSDKLDWLGMEYNPTTKYARIFYSYCNEDTDKFSGIVKNKSELKRLMQQLNIK